MKMGIKERKGKERKGKERKEGKERKGRERKGKASIFCEIKKENGNAA